MAAGGPAAQPGVVRRPTLTVKPPRLSRGKSASVGLRGGVCYPIAFSAGQNQSSGARFRGPGVLPGCKATQALGPELARVAQAQGAVPCSPSFGGDSGRVGPCLVSLSGNCLGRRRGGIGTLSHSFCARERRAFPAIHHPRQQPRPPTATPSDRLHACSAREIDDTLHGGWQLRVTAVNAQIGRNFFRRPNERKAKLPLILLSSHVLAISYEKMFQGA
jgi:hypothetical protein